MEEDSLEGMRRKGDEGGRKRRRNEEKEEESGEGGGMKRKKVKSLEEFKKLNLMRAGRTLRISSETHQSPSIVRKGKELQRNEGIGVSKCSE